MFVTVTSLPFQKEKLSSEGHHVAGGGSLSVHLEEYFRKMET